MEELAQTTQMGIVDSTSILVLDDYLDFDPFTCASIEAAVSSYFAMAGALNRHSLYLAYSLGRLLNKEQLKSKFGVSLVEVAKLLKVSKMTVLRWRKVYESLTPNQVKQLASRMVSANAVLAIANIKLEHEEEGKALLDALMSGELHTAKDVEDAFVNKLETKLLPYNLMPGGTPGEQEETEEDFDAQQLLAIEEDKSAAERLAELNGETFIEDFGPETVKTKAEKPKEKVKHETISLDDEDEEDTQNKRDIKALMRSSKPAIAALNRDLVAVIENVNSQLDVLHDRSAVIMGDDETFEEYTQALEGVYCNVKTAAEKLIAEVKRGIEHGLIKGKLVLPESADVDELFRKENG